MAQNGRAARHKSFERNRPTRLKSQLNVVVENLTLITGQVLGSNIVPDIGYFY
jgi:hypothetical protein